VQYHALFAHCSFEINNNVPLFIHDTLQTYLMCDGGLADNLRPAMYGAKYTCLPTTQPQRVDAADGRAVDESDSSVSGSGEGDNKSAGSVGADTDDCDPAGARTVVHGKYCESGDRLLGPIRRGWVVRVL
jgi:diaminopimelate decarboxylase